MKENPVIGVFYEILKKYGLIKPVPEEIQKRILKVKKKQFRETLKKAGASSFLFVVISHLFFIIKRCGFNVTMAQSAAIAGALSVVTAGIITAGSYAAATGLLSRPPERTVQHRDAEAEADIKAPVLPENKKRFHADEVPGKIDDEKLKRDSAVPERERKKKEDFNDEPVNHVPGM
jgi:hypothetical protein